MQDLKVLFIPASTNNLKSEENFGSLKSVTSSLWNWRAVHISAHFPETQAQIIIYWYSPWPLLDFAEETREKVLRLITSSSSIIKVNLKFFLVTFQIFLRWNTNSAPLISGRNINPIQAKKNYTFLSQQRKNTGCIFQPCLKNLKEKIMMVKAVIIRSCIVEQFLTRYK